MSGTTEGRIVISKALLGGYAVALHGARGTVDIDIVLRWTLRDLEAA